MKAIAYMKSMVGQFVLVACLKNLAQFFGLLDSRDIGKSAQVTAVAKFVPREFSGRRISNDTQRKALELLVKQRMVTRRELDSYLCVVNSPDVLMRMARRCGWVIYKIDYWRTNELGGRKRRYFSYVLSIIDCEIAKRMLQMDVTV